MKKYLILLLCFVICLSMCACNKNDKTPDVTQPSTNTNPTDTSNPDDVQTDTDIVLKDVEFDKYLWEKDLNPVGFETIKLDKNWGKSIVVGTTTISATTITEIANVDNYFYTDRGLCGDLEASYLTPKTGVVVSSPFVAIDDDACFYGQVVLLSTTYNQNSIVENVQFVGVPNVFVNNGMSHVVENAAYKTDDAFGIGSTYEYVNKIVGDCTNKFDTVMEDGITTTTYIYIGENVEMTLVFTRMSNDAENSGVLTTITWTPTAIKEALHMNIVNDPLHGVDAPGTHDAIVVPDGDGLENESTEPTDGETIENN